jgi:hypothetical protein
LHLQQAALSSDHRFIRWLYRCQEHVRHFTFPKNENF